MAISLVASGAKIRSAWGNAVAVMVNAHAASILALEDGRVLKSGDTMTGDLTTTRLRITATNDASLASTAHGIQVGDTSGPNLIMDNNEIIARDNGGEASLLIQLDGGRTRVGDNMEVVGPLTSLGGLITDYASNEHIKLSPPSGDTSGRPYIGIYAHNTIGISRSGYIGYPTIGATSEFTIKAERGNLVLDAAAVVSAPPIWTETSASTTNGVRINGSGGALQKMTSQARFKDDFQPIDDAIDKMMALKPLWFRSKLEGDRGRSFYGFTAEDSASVDRRYAAYDDDEFETEVMPEGVCGPPAPIVKPIGEQTPVGVDQGGILATAIAVIQKQQRMIEDLRTRVELLESDS